ncbi:MAG: SagB/ThcOx family dehydrogenase [Armatimonadota bacterium]
MRRTLAIFVVALVVGVMMMTDCTTAAQETAAEDVIDLPEADTDGQMSVEEAISRRRSVRSFSAKELSIQQIGQLAWAAQGITEPSQGLRAAPSAGATYPLEVYLVTTDGLYQYRPEGHSLLQIGTDDLRQPLAAAALGQEWVSEANVNIVIAGVYERTAGRYGDRARRYVHMEAGHAAENILLQAVALGLGAVPVGAFDDDGVAEVLDLAADEAPLYIIPVGYPE